MSSGPSLRATCILSANEEPEQLHVSEITTTGAFLLCRRLRAAGSVLMVRLQPEGCEARVEMRALVIRVVDLNNAEPGMGIVWLEASSRSAASLEQVLRTVIGLADAPNQGATAYTFAAAHRLMGTLREDPAAGGKARAPTPAHGMAAAPHAAAMRPPPPMDEVAAPPRPRARTAPPTPTPAPTPAAAEPKAKPSLVKKLWSITDRLLARGPEPSKLGAMAVSPGGRYYNPAHDLVDGKAGEGPAEPPEGAEKP